ncbi:MAG: CehA/McbA family metallohydrolase [Deltaproteobacteria bacterium]|nr:CehA/McbA family metallohydrolase [Deltaproteobacteria bacterium]
MANSLLTNHPYLLELGNRDLLESIVAEADQPEKNADLEDRLVELLESVSTTINVAWGAEAKPGINSLGTVSLPGDRGGILFKVSKGQGPVSFKTSTTDMAWTEKYVPIPIASSGTTWSLLTFEHMPDGPNLLYAAFEEEEGSITAIPIQVNAPKPGRLRLTVLSDDTGEPTPAMIQLKWLFDGSLRVPENTVNLTSQFDSQARTRDRPTGSRQLDLPGITEGDYWIVRGPIDMMIPPGQWQISILRGLEHLQVIDTFKISSGKTVDKTYRPKRWVNMAEKGWYSGDDHVHAQVMSQTDADNLLTWALAEDVHLVNLLEMGDHERSYFQQRTIGKPGRIQNGDTILVPGQEDPRIRYLGHTIALNIPQRVRDTSKYFLHDWVYDRVHELGGLYGYAHINRELFSIHRNMALNIPKQKVDFVELLQFHLLGTRLYYEFLNLGYKITASAGSDVPWGDTMGEVRVYAFVPEKNFTSDAWFQALAEGHTFVTNGPMIEFTVNDAIPGDEINIGQNTRKLKVKARAWGHSDRLTPTRLEIVKHGEVVKSATGSSSQELQLDFELDPGMGCWLAARAYADNGSAAHTTPIYISRPNLRFWDYDHALSLIDQRMSSLIEIENMVKAVSDIQPTQASGEPTEGEGGALIGLWYGNANLTRPAGVDIFSLPAQRWPAASVRGGNWSAQWKGTLTLPSSVPESIRLFLDSSGPTSLSIDGKVIFSKEVRGEESVEIQLKPNTAHEVSLTYTNRRPPKSYLNLSWSAKGQDKQPVPAHWFAYDQQHRAAVRHAVGTEVDTFQLQEQADSLMDRVEGARGLYNDLRAQWRKESSKRGRQ